LEAELLLARELSVMVGAYIAYPFADEKATDIYEAMNTAHVSFKAAQDKGAK